MSHELPEFSDDLSHCDACAWPEADTVFVTAILGAASVDRKVNPCGGHWPVFAFLKRTCIRCGFEWAEACVSPRQPDPQDKPDPLCDVRSVGGSRCVLSADHFDHYISPHQFGHLK